MNYPTVTFGYQIPGKSETSNLQTKLIYYYVAIYE